MFFTSYEFLFLFLPMVWTVFMLLIGGKSAWLASHWLIIASLLSSVLSIPLGAVLMFSSRDVR